MSKKNNSETPNVVCGVVDTTKRVFYINNKPFDLLNFMSAFDGNIIKLEVVDKIDWM